MGRERLRMTNGVWCGTFGAPARDERVVVPYRRYLMELFA